jgi:hypothetical protein
MSMIDPKGSRLESAAMAIIRADRAKKHPQHIVLSPDSEGAKSNVETENGFWKSIAGDNPALSEVSKFKNWGDDPISDSVQLILP